MDEKLTSGLLLRQTFAVFFANFVPFTLISALVLSPTLLLRILQFRASTESELQSMGMGVLITLLTVLLGPVATAALTYGVFQNVRGKPPTLRDCLGTGFRLLPAVLSVSILSGLAVVAGALLCIIPAFIVASMLAAAVPAAVIERPGIVASLRRSQSLTDGYRWTVLCVILGIWLIEMAANMAAVGLTHFAPALVRLIVVLALLVVLTGLQATAPALIYYHLRRVKESIDVEEIAAVFD